MELLMIYKISPSPFLKKRGKERENFTKEGGREKAEMPHSIMRSAYFKKRFHGSFSKEKRGIE
jgi:hypothetical protein